MKIAEYFTSRKGQEEHHGYFAKLTDIQAKYIIQRNIDLTMESENNLLQKYWNSQS